jgi:hypothetical protein
MASVKYFALAAAAVFIYTACARDALANNANATEAAEKTAPGAPPKVALATLNVKSIGVTDATATMLSPTVGILTFKATADGTCFGQKVGAIYT